MVWGSSIRAQRRRQWVWVLWGWETAVFADTLWWLRHQPRPSGAMGTGQTPPSAPHVPIAHGGKAEPQHHPLLLRSLLLQ